MRKNVCRLIILALAFVLLLSGCGGNAAEINLVPATIATEAQVPAGTTAATETDAPETPKTEQPITSAAAAPTPTENPIYKSEEFFVDGTKIYRQSEEGKSLVYDAADYFDEGWSCQLSKLLVENDALYFTEGGMFGDGSTEEDIVNRVIRKDEYGRTVIQEDNVIGYTQLVLYGDKVFIVQDEFDSQNIKWAHKDGKSAANLDFSDYAAHNGVLPYYNSAFIYFEDGNLYADISFYVDENPDTGEEFADQTVSISEDLEITRVR